MIYAASIWNIWIIPSALQKSLFHQQQHCLQCVHIIKTTYQLLLTHIITVTLILFKNGLTVLVVVTTSSNSCFENLLSFCTYIVLGRSTKFVCARGWGILFIYIFLEGSGGFEFWFLQLFASYSKFVIFRFDPTLTFAYAVIIYLLQLLYIKLNYFLQFKYIMHVCNPCTYINFYYLSVTWVIVVCCTLPAINMLGYFEKAVWVFQYLIYLTCFFKVYYRTILSIQLSNLKLNNKDGWCCCKYD